MATTSPDRSLTGAKSLTTNAAKTRVSTRAMRDRPKMVLFYFAVALFVIFCLAPFVWTFITSLKGPDTIYHRPIDYLPNPINLVNYQKIFGLARFTHSLLNSAIVAASATVVSLVVGSFCAYAVARLDFPGKNLLLAFVLAVAMFPGIAIIGPLYQQFRDWNLTNTYWSLILPDVTFTLPLCIWTLTAFFRDLPMELEESARVDGCGRMGTFFRIIAPLATPGMFTVAILVFIAAWNEYLFARTFMSEESKLTATIVIAQFEGADVASAYPWGQITAASVIVTIPLVVLVLIFQRRIISGLTAGAVKG